MKSSFGRFVAAVAAGVAGFAVTASAATTTYTGAGANSNWSTAANWTGPLTNGDAVVLSGTTGARKNMNNDALTDVASMEFTTSGNTLNGNALTMFGGFITSVTGVQTINLQINGGNYSINTAPASSGIVLNGPLSGVGSITKTGAGRLEINNVSNTFNGTLDVNGGAVLGNGVSQLMAVTMNSGTLTPGPIGSIGAMEFGALTLTSGAVSQMSIDDPGNYDQIDMLGNMVYGGTMNLTFDDASLRPDFTSWSLYDFGGTATGDFSAFNWNASNSPYSGLSFTQDPITNLWTSGTFTGLGGSTQFFVFENSTGNLVLVPEPSTMVFAAIGLVVSGAHVMRKRRKAAAVIAG